MSLLLTKTCEYAILVSIQQGRYFSTRDSYKIETELDLKLPPSIDDLIPTRTTITSPIQKVDANGHLFFNVSLVYFVSFKQLQRLRRNEATTTLTIKRVSSSTSSNEEQNNKLIFSISEAKEVIPQSQHKLDHIYKFVSDKGAWYNLENSRQQIKVGLFYVAMPDNSNSNNSTVSGSSVILNTPSIQLRSPPPTPIMPKSRINTNSVAAATANLNNSRKNKKITSILGTAPSLSLSSSSSKKELESSSSSGSTTTTGITRKKKYSVNEDNSKPPLQQRIPLRRTKSSLVDLNIEELADVLAKINIFDSPAIPAVPKLPKDIIEQQQQQSYHQIGKGSSKYTFYFKIIHADHIKQQTLLRQSTSTTRKHLKKPFFSYSFLTNYNLVPAASIINRKRHEQEEKCCFQLRGRLMDIQNWLDSSSGILLNYIIMDKYKKETVGKSQISLKGIAFQQKGILDKVYPVYLIEQEDDIIAQVTVRIGLVSGWHKENEYEYDFVQIKEQQQKKRQQLIQQQAAVVEAEHDPWDLITSSQNKKQRHLSQSSVPTLLTSSTTSSTKSSTHKEKEVVPTIHYVPSSQQQKRPFSFSKKASKYYSSTSTFTLPTSRNL